MEAHQGAIMITFGGSITVLAADKSTNTFRYQYEAPTPEGQVQQENAIDAKYDEWIAAGESRGHISKSDFQKTHDLSKINQLDLSETETKGIAEISKATGFSRTTIHHLYGMSVASGAVTSMRNFIDNMTKDKPDTYGPLKKDLSTDDRARIISILV